jgi:hypothetical protein
MSKRPTTTKPSHDTNPSHNFLYRSCNRLPDFSTPMIPLYFLLLSAVSVLTEPQTSSSQGETSGEVRGAQGPTPFHISWQRSKLILSGKMNGSRDGVINASRNSTIRSAGLARQACPVSEPTPLAVMRKPYAGAAEVWSRLVDERRVPWREPKPLKGNSLSQRARW